MKTKELTLADHKRYKQSNKPVKTRSKYMQLTRSAGKRVQNECERVTIGFLFYFLLDEKVARVF